MAFNLFKNTKSKKKPGSATSGGSAVTKTLPEVIQPDKTEKTFKLSQNSVVLHPYISEKASRLEGVNQYVFKVGRTANKPEVKKAIQTRYSVSVVGVNMVNIPSKKRTVGRYVGKKSGFRKAIVTLAKGESINSAKS